LLVTKKALILVSTNTEKHKKMTKAELKKEVEKLANECNIDFIKAAQHLQSASAKLGNERMIGILHDLKMEHLDSIGKSFF